MMSAPPPPSFSPPARPDLLLDRLRFKCGQLRSLSEMAKAVRSTLADRRFVLDSVEKDILQKGIDAMQETIPVRSAPSMAERLETIGRKIGLKFMGAPAHGHYFLSTEMFYVEINIHTETGNVEEAKIHHIDATQQANSSTHSCPEIMSCLSKGDFNSFIKHLEGLMSIYNLNGANAQDKTRAWIALISMEKDLETLYNPYSSWPLSTPENVISLVHRSPLGQAEPRCGGLPLKLRYFLPPHDLLDEETQTLLPCTTDLLTERDLGLSVVVTVEKSETTTKMQLRSVISANGGKEELSANNSVNLPARFCLRLNKPMPMSLEKCRQIQHLTGFDFLSELPQDGAAPLMQLIAKNKSKGALDGADNRGLFVTLPDQQHCYFISDPSESKGILVSSIPFSHPANVQEIIAILREQAIFNTLIESCVRVTSIQDLESSVLFEISSTDLQHMSVTFEVPSSSNDSMGELSTLEIDLSDYNKLKCKMYAPRSSEISADSLASKILQRSFSLPITMRLLIRKFQGIRAKAALAEENLKMTNGNSVGHIQNSGEKKSDLHSKKYLERDKGGGGDMDIKTEPMDYETTNSNSKKNPYDSLNVYGPQDATSNPEVFSSTITMGGRNSHSTSTNEKSRKNTSAPSSVIKPDIIVSPTSEGKLEAQVQSSKGHHSSSDSRKDKKETSSSMSDIIKPKVTITPISSAQSSTESSTTSKKAGIEIIPWVPPGMEHSKNSSNRDIRRSLSEDDGGLDSKSSSSSKKRGRESSSRDSSSFKKKLLSSTPDSKKSSSSSSSSNRKVTSSVMDRLAQSSAETGIEVLPATSATSSSSSSKSKDKDKSSSRGGDSLKLTIKSSSGSSSKYSSSSKSKSSSSPSSRDKSSSSKHSSSKGVSSSGSSHRYSSSSQSSKDRSKYSSSSDKDRKRSSTHSSDRHYDRSKDHGRSSSGGSNINPSSTSGGSSNHYHSERDKQEEVKKVLEGGKLNKTFQIPKLSKSSSPSSNQMGSKSSDTPRQTPTSSPKYAISPKPTPSSANATAASSPKYIGGGAVTPPNISPKHSYSAPSSVPGLTRSSPMHTSPKAPVSRTPGASPTYHSSGNVKHTSSPVIKANTIPANDQQTSQDGSADAGGNNV